MDELLRHNDLPFGSDDHNGAETANHTWKEKFAAAAGKVRAAVAKHPVSPLLYVVVLAIAAGVLVFRSVYIPAYAVQVDGVEVGLVSDTAEVEAAVSNVEDRVASVLGVSYDYNAEVTYTPVYSTADDLSDVQEIEDYLYDNAGAIMEGWVLTVGGQEIGCAANEEDIQSLLDKVAQPYITEDTKEYGFVEEVSVTSREMASDTKFDLDAIYNALTANSIEEAVYVVEKGDTFSRIAKGLDMTVSDLSALNPDVVIDKIWIGQELVIQQSVPYLSVYTIDNETYEQPIESPIEYTETASMYVGETKVTEEGEDGLAEVNADVTYVNGYETERNVLTTTVLQEPTTTYMLKGTTPKPKTASKGYYAWPVSGKISSRYGYRHGEFHTGLDIAVPYGTTVKAADGGTVTYAGWKGNYGNLVIITHDNGAQTYYAHNSSLLVSAGTRVYQGQAIAKAGSTGRSTGNHCHFEIRIGGKTVNPLNYLK